MVSALHSRSSAQNWKYTCRFRDSVCNRRGIRYPKKGLLAVNEWIARGA